MAEAIVLVLIMYGFIRTLQASAGIPPWERIGFIRSDKCVPKEIRVRNARASKPWWEYVGEERYLYYFLSENGANKAWSLQSVRTANEQSVAKNPFHKKDGFPLLWGTFRNTRPSLDTIEEYAKTLPSSLKTELLNAARTEAWESAVDGGETIKAMDRLDKVLERCHVYHKREAEKRRALEETAIAAEAEEIEEEKEFTSYSEGMFD